MRDRCGRACNDHGRNVTAVCGFFAPGLVRRSWEAALAAASPDDLVSEDVRLCITWARGHLAGLSGIGRLADLAARVVEAADASGRALFAAWRALPDPAEDRAARAGLALLRLREHRGSGHLIAVTAQGLTPLAAILAGPGPAKAAANGWDPPYAHLTQRAAQRLAAAERRTDALAGRPYACLDAAERAELVALLDSVHRHLAGLSTSPLRTVELFRAGLARVAGTRYLGRLLSLSASPALRDGHRAASRS